MSVVHSVVAAVVRARVLVATAAWALEINEQITSSWQSTLRTVERRYRAGYPVGENDSAPHTFEIWFRRG